MSFHCKLLNSIFYLIFFYWVIGINGLGLDSDYLNPTQEPVNLTEKYSKCLLPNQKTNFSLDGLTNCTCLDGFDHDLLFNVCFENKCNEICGGNMSCSILKHGIRPFVDFEYYCYCSHGYDRIDPYYPFGCVTIEQKFINITKLSKNESYPVPINPFLAEIKNCSQTYELTASGDVECKCFNGYKMDENGKCRKFGRYVNYCKDDVKQILALDEYDQTICKCKPGFGGESCNHNFCNWPVRSSEEKRYLEKSIESFCGVPDCRLVFDKFKCLCPQPFSEETEDGKCRLVEKRNQSNCSNDELCKMKQKDAKCDCAEQSSENDLIDSTLDLNFKPTESKEYCLPGYLPNPDYDQRKDYRQKCIKGQTSFEFKFQLRFDLSLGNNSVIFLNNFYQMEQDVDLNRIPRNLVQDYVNYKDRTVIDTIKRKINKESVKRKMETIILDAFDNQMFKNNYHKGCVLIPELDFNYDKFNPFRLIETLVDVRLQVTCKYSTTGELFGNFFKFYLTNSFFNDNYREFRNVGHIVPESIGFDLNSIL